MMMMMMDIFVVALSSMIGGDQIEITVSINVWTEGVCTLGRTDREFSSLNLFSYGTTAPT
jgi:hypothetical protein